MEQTLGALERAIKTLSGAGTKTALLQMSKPSDELSLLSSAAAVHEAVKALPSGHQLSSEQLSALQAFTSDPAEFYDKKAEKAAEAAKKKEEAEAKKAEKAASKGEKKEAPSKPRSMWRCARRVHETTARPTSCTKPCAKSWAHTLNKKARSSSPTACALTSPISKK